MARSEVNLTALFCAFCQGFTSILLLQDFISKNKEEEEEQAEDSEPQLEARTIILVKFICAVLFHFKFETEIRSSIQMMKFAALHSEYFENPIRAWF